MPESTQDFVPIKEIRNGVIMLEDGSLRVVLMTSSHNLALKSEDEQKAILMQFQNFLNSLDFSVQFFVQSRDLDIRPYIALLEERKKAQVLELLTIQIGEYIKFIKEFTGSVNVMSKSFFVVIPYTPPTVSGASAAKGIGGFLENLPFGPKKTSKQKIASRDEMLERFEENKTQLEQRVLVVEQGLSSTGVRIARLGTEELIELFYKAMNPGEAEKPISLDDRRGATR